MNKPRIKFGEFKNSHGVVKTITVDDKYEIREALGIGTLVVFKHGEPWRDFTKDKFIHSLVDLLYDLSSDDQEQKEESNSIEVGDIVRVDCNNGQITISHEAEVLYVPCGTGDSWRFRDLRNKNLVYVSEGITIILLRKGGRS